MTESGTPKTIFKFTSFNFLQKVRVKCLMGKKMLDSGIIQEREKHAHPKQAESAANANPRVNPKVIRSVAFSLGLLLALCLAIPAMAANGDSTDAWASFGKGLVGLFSKIKPFVIGLAIASLIINGIGVMVGGPEHKQQFKQGVIWTIVGAAVILLAGQLAEKIVEGAQGGDSSNGDDYQKYVKMIQFAANAA